jgi:hypothetical protein
MESLHLYHLDAWVVFLFLETQVEPQEPRQEAPESGEETQVEPRPEPRQPRQGEGRKEEAGPLRLLQPPQVPEEEQAINPWPCCTDMCCSIYSKKPVFCIRIFRKKLRFVFFLHGEINVDINIFAVPVWQP